MGKTLDLNCIARLVPQVQRFVDQHGESRGDFDSVDYDKWREQTREADEALVRAIQAFGGRVIVRPTQSATVKIGGLTSSSTSGLSAACTNWLIAARNKIHANGDT